MKTLRLALLGAALLLAAGSSRAAEFAMFMHESPAQLKLRTDSTAAGKAYWDAYAQFGRQLKEAGVLRGGGALQTDAATQTLKMRAGVPQLKAGPNGKAAEQLGGYFIIDVVDMASALQWAQRAPAADSGAVEVRPLYPVPAGMM